LMIMKMTMNMIMKIVVQLRCAFVEVLTDLAHVQPPGCPACWRITSGPFRCGTGFQYWLNEGTYWTMRGSTN
jgi:hypothetical protein